MSLRYDIVIPTHRTDGTIDGLLRSIARQTVQPQQVIIVFDRQLDDIQRQSYLHTTQSLLGDTPYTIISPHTHSDYTPGQGASYLRNTGIQHASADYVICVDDDNTRAPDMIAELQQVYTQHDLATQQALLIPTEHYRDTQQIRSQGYSTYHYTLGRVVPEAPLMPDATPLKPIAYAATNCIRGPRQVMLDHPLDEALPFVYEDLEWTSRLVQAGHPLYAATSVYTQHHMRTKTPAQESYIHTDSSLYHKARHRIIRVRRMASTAQLVIYYTIGLPLHTAALIYKILRYISPRHRRSRLSTLARGTRSGLTHSLADVAPS